MADDALSFSRRVARRFGGAAGSYDAFSGVQRRAAERLAALIGAESLPAAPRILEVGCGTGHLTELLALRFPQARLLATDIAPSMAAACRARLPHVDCAVMDACRPAVAGPFDLVCSNFAAQWFPDLAAAVRALARCLAPGGLLAMSLLGEGTFAEWRAAHRRLGLADALQPFPSLAACRAAFSPLGRLAVETERHPIRPASALAFMRYLRALGADTPAPGRAPLSPGTTRRLLRELGERPTLTYEVHYCALRV